MYAREFVPGQGLWGDAPKNEDAPAPALPPGVAGGAFSSFPPPKDAPGPDKEWKPSADPTLAVGGPPPMGSQPNQWIGPNQVPDAQALGPGPPPGGAGCVLFWDLAGCRPGGTDAGKGVKQSVRSLYGDVRSARAYGDVAALPAITRAGLQAAGVLLIDTGPAGMTDRSPIIVDLFDYALDHATNRKDEKAPILVVALGGAPREQFGLAFARLAERGFKLALIRPRDSPCARYDGGCIGVHDWASVRPGDDNDIVAMCFKCGWRNCRRVHPRRCSALVCCALCGQTSHDTRYHTEFQQYVSRRATETTQRQVEAAAAQGLTIPHYNAPRLTAIPPAFPNQYPGQMPSPGLAALQHAMRQQGGPPPPRPPYPGQPGSPPRPFAPMNAMMGTLDLSGGAPPWQPGAPPPVPPLSPPALLQPQAFPPAPSAPPPAVPPPAPAAAPPPAEKPVPEPKEPPTTVSPPTPPPPGLEPPPAEPAEDPVDLSRLHYGVEDYVKMGVPEEDARAILRAVNKLAKDRDAAQGPPDAAPTADAAAAV
jgi:hypothetical protein